MRRSLPRICLAGISFVGATGVSSSPGATTIKVRSSPHRNRISVAWMRCQERRAPRSVLCPSACRWCPPAHPLAPCGYGGDGTGYCSVKSHHLLANTHTITHARAHAQTHGARVYDLTTCQHPGRCDRQRGLRSGLYPRQGLYYSPRRTPIPSQILTDPHFKKAAKRKRNPKSCITWCSGG